MLEFLQSLEPKSFAVGGLYGLIIMAVIDGIIEWHRSLGRRT